jgi:hypothetical protein
MKKVAVLMLSTLMLLLSFSSVSAAERRASEQDLQNALVITQKEKILAIMEELSEYRANRLLQAAKSEEYGVNTYNYNSSMLDSTEVRLEAELQKLGVNPISYEEALAIHNGSSVGGDVSIQVTVPPSNSNVRWYELNYYITRSGTTYEIQELYAQGLSNGTNLAKGQNGVTLYTIKQIAVKNLTQIASVYAQKVIGLIPIVQWLPYEFLFSDNSQVTNNSHVITHRSLSTVCFTYVKLSGQSDNYQNLSFISNMVTIASSHTLAGYRNGSPYSKTTDKVNTEYASNYASGTAAVNSFTDPYAPRSSYISFYRFYNHDQTASLTQYIINPSFPAQITQ